MKKLAATSLFLGFVAAGACSVPDPSEGSGGSSSSSDNGPNPTQLCETMCFPLHQAGQAAYGVLRGCLLCNACGEACAANSGNLCGEGGAAPGCPAESCEGCLNDPCALTQLPDTSFTGICSVDATACAADVECVGLNNCVATCVINEDWKQDGAGGATSAAGGMGGAGGL